MQEFVSTPRISVAASVEQRVTALERKLRSVNNKDKDRWDKAQIVASFISSVVIAAVGIAVNFQLSLSRDTQVHQQENNRLAQVVAEIESSREKSDTEIRAKIFEVLIQRYFEGSLDDRKNVMLLSLIQSNFQEFFSTGPLFVAMYKEIKDPEQKDALKTLASAVADRQELMLGAGKTPAERFLLDETRSIPVGEHRLAITLTAIDGQNVRVRVRPDTASPTMGEDELTMGDIEFSVSPFDMPLMDNTKLPDGHRFAITLKGVNPKENSASLKVFEFDRDFLTSRDRPGFSELKHQLSVAIDKHRSDDLHGILPNAH